ncbi:outer membrane protein assembly factor BamA [Crenobacter cavernae]|uniref:Outer membrane protein assembly factor BamA n=1 Tax=Crenobacter cavernae TaxID=2290923 RepID=A0A345Y834_9NEIS|nr:outer membrane protein assembly factor BamA [Crenobacter cavernae]AXK40086.1 outer membrane protein assembly factor BamA [Crenobacter cavernae]
MRMKLVAAAILGLSTSAAWALEPFVIKDIRVEGLQRTEPGTVFNYLPIKAGDTFTDDKAQEAIKALFATGFFDDVRVEAENNVVVLAVVERPVIAQLTISGSKEFDKEQIKKSLKNNGFSESRVFDQALLDQAVQALKREYFSRGKYSVAITPTVTRLERNRVAVTLDIAEGVTAKIKDIHIVGAKAFKEDDLRDLFSLTTGGWFSWITKDDQYSKQKLSADLEKLRAFYQNQGYLEFSIESTQVSMSADKEAIYLTVNVNEGKRYTVSDIKFAGDLKVPEDELSKLLKVKQGDVFSRELVNESVTAISERLGNDGYAFANVNVVPDIDREKETVAFTLFVDPGRKTYVRRVNITGNNKTRDEVIRREMRQLEGAPYASDKIKRSKDRTELLGYFEQVNIETPAVPDTPDQVDVNVNVKERPTGSVSAGVGFVQGEGLQLSANVSQSNIFGSGKSMSVGFSNGKVNKFANISFTDPYFTPDGVSLGYDLYLRDYRPDEIDQSQYRTKTTGFSVRSGVPVTEFDRINFSLGVENTKITTFTNSPQRYLDFVNQYGSNNNTLLGTVGWARDTRDSALWPTRGGVLKANADSGLPGGDIEYYRLTGQATGFFPLSKTFTLMLNGEVGYADGYGKTSRLPFFQNFYLGGIGSVRGYDTGSIGPKASNGDYLGGTRKIVANAELLFPFPGMKDNKSVRTSLFFDAGSLWDDKESGSSVSDALRYSAGAAVTWLSPVGPMKFSYARPIRKKEGDKAQSFQFQLGTVF